MFTKGKMKLSGKSFLIALVLCIAISAIGVVSVLTNPEHAGQASAVPHSQVSVWDGTADTSWYVGNESATSYTLTNARQLGGLRQLVNAAQANAVNFSGKTIVLASDIDLNGRALSLGNYSQGGAFAGNFDGGHHTIYGGAGYTAEPLFAFITHNNASQSTTIKNLVLDGMHSNAGGNYSGLGHIGGGLVGQFSGANGSKLLIENISVKNAIISKASAPTANVRLGGIIAYVNAWGSASNTVIRNCTFEGELKAWNGTNTDRWQHLGGIVGDGRNYTVEGCYSGANPVTNLGVNGTARGRTRLGTIIGGLRETTSRISPDFPDNPTNPLTIANLNIAESNNYYNYDLWRTSFYNGNLDAPHAMTTFTEQGSPKSIHDAALKNGTFSRGQAYWLTTDSLNVLEISSSTSTYGITAPPSGGPNFIELAASAGAVNNDSQIYQIFDTVPGTTYNLSFLYRNRTGVGVPANQRARIRIGAYTPAMDANGTANGVANNATSIATYATRKAALQTIPVITNGNITATGSWVTVSRTYTVPANQTRTVLVLENDPNYPLSGSGNMVANISFASGTASPGKAQPFEIFLNPQAGNDSSAGTTATTAVKTLERARFLVQYGGNIILTDSWGFAGGESGFIHMTGLGQRSTLSRQNDRTIQVSGNVRFDSITYDGACTTNTRMVQIGPPAPATSQGRVIIHEGATFKGHSNTASPISVGSGGTLSLKGGTLTGLRQTGATSIGAAVHIFTGGTFNMYSGTISNVRGQNAGAIWVASGANTVFNMYGGTIEDSHAIGGSTSIMSGGAVNISGGVFNMLGGTIRNSTSGYIGGGVSVVSSGKATMTGGTIENNTATRSGGGILVGATSTFEFISGTISGNKASGGTGQSMGGNVAVTSGGTFEMKGGILEKGEARLGGGIYTRNDVLATTQTAGNIIISGGTIRDNKAIDTNKNNTGGDGGAICVFDSSESVVFQITGGTFTNNTAERNGDVIYLGTLGVLDIRNTTFARSALSGTRFELYNLNGTVNVAGTTDLGRVRTNNSMVRVEGAVKADITFSATTVFLRATGALVTGADIKIISPLAAGQKVAEGLSYTMTATDTARFSATGYTASLEGNSVFLKAPRTATIAMPATATFTGSAQNVNTVTVTLAPASGGTTGTPTLTYSHALFVSGRANESYTYTAGMPINVGRYVIKVDASATSTHSATTGYFDNYVIAPAGFVLRNDIGSTVKDKVYYGDILTSAITSSATISQSQAFGYSWQRLPRAEFNPAQKTSGNWQQVTTSQTYTVNPIDTNFVIRLAVTGSGNFTGTENIFFGEESVSAKTSDEFVRITDENDPIVKELGEYLELGEDKTGTIFYGTYSIEITAGENGRVLVWGFEVQANTYPRVHIMALPINEETYVFDSWTTDTPSQGSVAFYNLFRTTAMSTGAFKVQANFGHASKTIHFNYNQSKGIEMLDGSIFFPKPRSAKDWMADGVFSVDTTITNQFKGGVATSVLPEPLVYYGEFDGWWTKDGKTANDYGTRITDDIRTLEDGDTLWAKWLYDESAFPVGVFAEGLKDKAGSNAPAVGLGFEDLSDAMYFVSYEMQDITGAITFYIYGDISESEFAELNYTGTHSITITSGSKENGSSPTPAPARTVFGGMAPANHPDSSVRGKEIKLTIASGNVTITNVNFVNYNITLSNPSSTLSIDEADLSLIAQAGYTNTRVITVVSGTLYLLNGTLKGFYDIDDLAGTAPVYVMSGTVRYRHDMKVFGNILIGPSGAIDMVDTMANGEYLILTLADINGSAIVAVAGYTGRRLVLDSVFARSSFGRVKITNGGITTIRVGNGLWTAPSSAIVAMRSPLGDLDPEFTLGYTTLQEAINEATAGETVYLVRRVSGDTVAGIELTESIVVNKNISLTSGLRSVSGPYRTIVTINDTYMANTNTLIGNIEIGANTTLTIDDIRIFGEISGTNRNTSILNMNAITSGQSNIFLHLTNVNVSSLSVRLHTGMSLVNGSFVAFSGYSRGMIISTGTEQADISCFELLGENSEEFEIRLDLNTARIWERPIITVSQNGFPRADDTDTVRGITDSGTAITYHYALFEEAKGSYFGDYTGWTAGLPTDAGSYVVRATSTQDDSNYWLQGYAYCLLTIQKKAGYASLTVENQELVDTVSDPKWTAVWHIGSGDWHTSWDDSKSAPAPSVIFHKLNEDGSYTKLDSRPTASGYYLIELVFAERDDFYEYRLMVEFRVYLNADLFLDMFSGERGNDEINISDILDKKVSDITKADLKDILDALKAYDELLSEVSKEDTRIVDAKKDLDEKLATALLDKFTFDHEDAIEFEIDGKGLGIGELENAIRDIRTALEEYDSIFDEFTDPDARRAIEEKFRETKNKLEQSLRDAEVELFRETYKDILLKDEEDINGFDLETILEALTFYDGLSHGAKIGLDDEYADLLLKLRKAFKKSFEDTFESLNKDYEKLTAEDWQELVNALDYLENLKTELPAELSQRLTEAGFFEDGWIEETKIEIEERIKYAKAERFLDEYERLLSEEPSEQVISDIKYLLGELEIISEFTKDRIVDKSKVREGVKDLANIAEAKTALEERMTLVEEVLAFREDYSDSDKESDILTKTVLTVKPADKGDILDALEAYGNLSEKAKELLLPEKGLLDGLLSQIEEWENTVEKFIEEYLSKPGFILIGELTLDEVIAGIETLENMTDEEQEIFIRETGKPIGDILGELKEKKSDIEYQNAEQDASKFKEDHREILDKVNIGEGKEYDLKNEELIYIINALEDYENLSDHAKSLLIKEKEQLDIAYEFLSNRKADDYISDFSELFEKPLSEISVGDLAEILEAIERYEDLHPSVKDLIEIKTGRDSEEVLAILEEKKATALEKLIAYEKLAEEFISTYGGLLDKSVGDIVISDLGLVLSAISDFEDFPAEVRDMISEIIGKSVSEIESDLSAKKAVIDLAEEFKADHSDILSKNITGVKASDKEAIVSALEDYGKLSPEVKVLLISEKAKLDQMLNVADALADLEHKVYIVEGFVVDGNGKEISGAEVEITVNGTNRTTVTNENGRFTLAGIPNGIYNVRMTVGGKTITRMANVNGSNTVLSDTVISGLNVSGNIEVKPGAPDAKADGMDEVANDEDLMTKNLTEEEEVAISGGGSAEMTLTVEAVETNTVIKPDAGKTIGLTLDITMVRTVFDADGIQVGKSLVSTLNSLVAIAIPLPSDIQGMANYVIYRMHNGSRDIITAVPNASGEHFILSQDGAYIIVYTKNFSTYSIGFDKVDDSTGGQRNICWIHWLLLVWILLYVIFVLIIMVVLEKVKHLSQIIGWAVYVVGFIVISIFLSWDVMCIMFFILGVIVALASLIYWLRYKEEGGEVEVRVRKVREPKPSKETKKETNELSEGEEVSLTEEESLEKDESELERLEEERLLRIIAEKKAESARIAKLNDEEAAKAEEERAKQRLLFIQSENERIQKERAELAIKNSMFKLSREDILDKMDEMSSDRLDFPVEANVRERTSEKGCDSLRAGAWTFAVMYESKAGIIKFMARMDEAYALSLIKDHPSVEASSFGDGENWYKVIIDSTYLSKKEVLLMLDNWYAFVVGKYYKYEAKEKKYQTDEAMAQKDSENVKKVSASASSADSAVEQAEKVQAEREAELLKNKSFEITKQEIATHIKEQFSTNVEVSERELASSTGMPLSDTYFTPHGISDTGKKKRVCYAYVYQLKDGNIKIIAKLPKVYSERLSKTHTTLCRSKFPAGKNWYVAFVDSSFKSSSDLFAILTRAKSFVESTETRD
ncbi:MAG: carboxypeptidase regulatory-like domain-containing protein [Firmicutes bacterium]|nr:carboxypeptidase regulatory-like domain-containing protein [Bacillota bacterium]